MSVSRGRWPVSPASVRTVRRPSFTGRITLLGHRFLRNSLCDDEADGPGAAYATEEFLLPQDGPTPGDRCQEADFRRATGLLAPHRRGGHGQVDQAADTKLNRQVTLKILSARGICH